MVLKKYLKILWLKVVRTVLVVLGTCIFVFPGVFCLVSFAFAELIARESPMLDTKGIFMLSHELSKGHRVEIFFRYFLTFLVIGLIVGLVFSVVTIFNHFCTISKTVEIIVILTAILLTFLLILPHLKTKIKTCFALAKREKIIRN